MTPSAIQVAIDILRELGHEEQARWIEHPDAVRRLLVDGTCVDKPRASAGWYCTGCQEHHMGPHAVDCSVMAAYRVLGDPRGASDMDAAHAAALETEGVLARGRLEAAERAKLRENIDMLTDVEVIVRIDGGEPSSDSTHDFIRWGVLNGYWSDERGQRLIATFPDKPGALPKRVFARTPLGRLQQVQQLVDDGWVDPSQFLRATE